MIKSFSPEISVKLQLLLLGVEGIVMVKNNIAKLDLQ